ncbi:MAG: hypothetical protein R3E89_15785 [Thiolinea sp.]
MTRDLGGTDPRLAGRNPCPHGRHAGLGLPQRDFIITTIQTCQHVSGPDPITHFGIDFHHARRQFGTHRCIIKADQFSFHIALDRRGHLAQLDDRHRQGILGSESGGHYQD